MGGESLDKKKILLRLDPSLHDKLKIWAKDDMRSINSHIEFILRKALEESRR
ncbi:MAG: hypothetical protein CMA64_02925 [Euryarchaeota archaeon]|nr:hypothetical protein [Euryarchaeota archaeon]|tara:strand:+ start:1079 stop:1234 length:156 start_codon:yes stop_codon:yes gene_type:complete